MGCIMSNGERGGGSMNGYIGLYKGKQYEVYAETSLKAQQTLAAKLGVKKSYEISVYLCEKENQPVTQSTQFLG